MNKNDWLHEQISRLQQEVGVWNLGHSDGRMAWPIRGVYFFYEPGEKRPNGTPRITRVGTHALKSGSQTTLWNRLSQHKGQKDGGGNHRGSVFRKHVGNALISQHNLTGDLVNNWGIGNTASKEIRNAEFELEKTVSDYICQMPFTVVLVKDEASPTSDRAIIETGCLSILSEGESEASASWLGHFCPANAVRKSGLWNVRDIGADLPSSFFDTLERNIEETILWKKSL